MQPSARLAVVALALACLFVAAPNALAATYKRSAPVKRAGITVGTGKSTLVIGTRGFTTRSSFVVAFEAPSEDATWRARTTLSVGCARPGFDPSSADPDDYGYVAITLNSRWKSTHLDGTRGTLQINRASRTCPDGKVPAGGALLKLTVQNAAGTTTVGRATLFAAG